MKILGFASHTGQPPASGGGKAPSRGGGRGLSGLTTGRDLIARTS